MRLLELLRGLLRFRAEDGERGAIIPMTAICLAVMITSVAFSVDLGMIAYRKRDLRSVADLATLDAARAIDRSGTMSAADQLGTREAPGPVWQATIESAARNGHVEGGGKAEQLTPIMGVWTPVAGFTPCPDNTDCIPNAVRVFAGETVPRYFAFFAEDRPLDLSATGVYPYAGTGCLINCEDPIPSETLLANAGVTIGSFVARADTTDSAKTPIYDAVLGGLLGATVTGVGYDGLAVSNVDLQDIATEMGFGSVDELLAADVTVPGLLQATADVLAANGASSATVSSLLSVAAASATSANVKLGKVFALSTGTGSVASTFVNAADLLFGVARASAAARVADGGNAASFNLPVSSTLAGLGVASIQATTAVVEAPQSASGPAELVAGEWVTRATSGQVVMAIQVELTNVMLLGQSASMSLPMLLDAGRGTAELTSVRCALPRSATWLPTDAYDAVVQTYGAKLAMGTVAASQLKTLSGASTSFGAAVAEVAELDVVVSVGGIPVKTVTMGARSDAEEVVAPGGPTTVVFTDQFDQVHTVGGTDPTVGSVDTLLQQDTDEDPIFESYTLDHTFGIDPLLDAEILILQAQLVADVEAVVDPLRGPLNQLVSDLNAGLGVTIGGADVTGGPRPYRPSSATDVDPNPRAADCPLPIPVLVSGP